MSDLFPLLRGYDLDTLLAKMQVHVEDLLLGTNRSLLLSINRFTSSYNSFAFTIIEDMVLATDGKFAVT